MADEGSIPEARVDGKEEEYQEDYDDGGGELLEVHVMPLLGSHAGESVTVEIVHPDVMFDRPMRLSSPEIQFEFEEHGASCLPVGPPTSAAIAAAMASLAWLAYRRARKHQRDFDPKVDKLERTTRRASELWRPDPAAAGYLGPPLRGRDGETAEERGREAKRCLGVLEGLVKEGLDVSRSLEGLVKEVAEASQKCPWDARGKNTGRLTELRRLLRKSVAKAERTREELEMILEVERVLYALDNSSTSGGSDNSLDLLLPPQTDNDEIGELPSERLCNRVTVMIGTQALTPAAAAVSARCVFPQELKACCKALESREHRAEDELKRGLKKWDLKAVDRALGQLQVLELRELAAKFEKQKQDVISKRWGLQETLRELQENVDREGPSRLREACVKAETFSCTDLPEYQMAKRTLEFAQATQLEAHARRVLNNHGLAPDPRCNVRLDPVGGATLRFEAVCPDELLGDSGGRMLHLENGFKEKGTMDDTGGRGHGFSSTAVSRTLELRPQEGDEDAPILGSTRGDLDDAEGNAEGRGMGEGRVVEYPIRGQHGQLGPRWKPRSARDSSGVVQEYHGEQQALMMNLRINLLREFSDYVTQQKVEHRRACDKDRRALERAEEEAAHHREHIDMMAAQKEQNGRHLRLLQERNTAKDIERKNRQQEKERREDDDRLKELWDADGNFFHSLTVVDLVLSACTIAWRKGFNPGPGAVWSGLWGLVVAECREEFSTAAYATASAAISAAGTVTAAGSGAYSPSATLDYAVAPADWSLQQSEACAESGVGEWGAGEMMELGEEADSDYGSTVTSALWWACSNAASYVGAAVKVGYSTSGWVLGQTLSMVSSDVQCEIIAVLSAMAWLFSLWLALRVVASLGADGPGPAATVTRLAVLASWVWGKFHVQLMEATHELLLPALPAPLLVLMCAPVLQYVERHRYPAGVWKWYGWDVRPFVFRVLPVFITAFVAVGLGSQAGCGAAGAALEWWCVL